MVLQEVKYNIVKDLAKLALVIIKDSVIHNQLQMFLTKKALTNKGREDLIPKRMNKYKGPYDPNEILDYTKTMTFIGPRLVSPNKFKSPEVRDFVKANDYSVNFEDYSYNSNGIFLPTHRAIQINTSKLFPKVDQWSLRVYDKYLSELSAEEIADAANGYKELVPMRVINSFLEGLYKKELISTLIHELQHAIDNFRSGGKYDSDKRSREYYAKARTGEYTPAGEEGPMKPGQYEEYLQLPHEYWARFSQFVNDVRWKHKRRLLDQTPSDLLRILRLKFKGWNQLSGPDKRRIIKATINYYEALKKNYKGDIIGPTDLYRKQSIRYKISNV